MMRIRSKIAEEFRTTLSPLGESWNAVGFVTATLALVLVYLHQGSAEFFVEKISNFTMENRAPLIVQWWGTIYQHGAAFFLFLLLPLIYLNGMKKQRLSALGLGLGDWRFGFKIVAPLGILLLSFPSALSAALMPDFVAQYPLAKLAGSNPVRFIEYELIYGLLYYTAYEAFFRGILQFSLRKHIGILGAILVQTAITTLLHIGKPEAEIWSALFAGLIFGALAFRLKSVWPLWIIHWSLGLFTDLFCSMAGG